MHGRGSDVLAVAILFFILTWITVGLRIYVRGILLRTWGSDDYFMFATLIIFTVYLAFQIVAALHGTGRHRWEISDDAARTALLFWYLCEVFYVLSNCTLKISLGTFYLRVAIRRWHVWSIWILMAGTVLFGAIYFFLVVFQCSPVSEFWNNHPASNKCIPPAPTKGITYALGVVNAAADWAFGILPFFIVFDLQMNIKTKILVAGILAFAAIGSTATVVRMQYIHTLTEGGPDFLFATTDVAIWSTVEPGIGITAGSIATLRPLFRITMWRLGLRPDSSSSEPLPSRSSERGREREWFNNHHDQIITELVPRAAGSTVSTVVVGPQALSKKHWGRSNPSRSRSDDDRLLWTEQPQRPQSAEEERQQEQEQHPPRLQLRESIYTSFVRGSILSFRELFREERRLGDS